MKKITYLFSLLFASMILMAQNQAPVAVNDTVKAVFGEEITINVLSNDYDPDGDDFHIKGISPSNMQDVVYFNDSIIVFLFTEYKEKTFYISYDIEDENGNWSNESRGEAVFLLESERFIDVNNIKALIRSTGDHFWDENQSLFEFPKESGKSTLSFSTLWMGGADEQGDLHMAAQTYSQAGLNYWNGPVSQGDSLYVNPIDAGTWNRVWKISKEEVINHKLHWNEPNYQMPEVISSWPAHGDPELNQAENIAPFVNIGGDEKYQPDLGDYPLIKGDQTLFFVFNDVIQLSALDLPRIGCEIHGMIWGINDESKPYYQNTIFLHYEIFNRSQNDYLDSFIGLFSEPDIGASYDDFIQSDILRSSFIAYNGDDEDNIYGINPPAQGIVLLGGPKMDEDDMDNSSGECNESINGIGFGDGVVDNERFGMTRFIGFNTNEIMPDFGNPNDSLSVFNLLYGRWLDGSPMLYPGADSIETVFRFPGDSDPCYWGTGGTVPDFGLWTEESEGNTPSDRKGFQSSGPFTFESGSKEVFDVAYVCAWDTINPYPASVDLLKVYIDSIRADYMTNSDDFGYDPALGIEPSQFDNLSLELYPNPANTTISLTVPYNFITGKVEVFDLNGRLVQNKTQVSTIDNQINIEALPSGFYTLRLIGKQNIYVGKFVKE